MIAAGALWVRARLDFGLRIVALRCVALRCAVLCRCGVGVLCAVAGALMGLAFAGREFAPAGESLSLAPMKVTKAKAPLLPASL